MNEYIAVAALANISMSRILIEPSNFSPKNLMKKSCTNPTAKKARAIIPKDSRNVSVKSKVNLFLFLLAFFGRSTVKIDMESSVKILEILSESEKMPTLTYPLASFAIEFEIADQLSFIIWARPAGAVSLMNPVIL